MVPEAYRLEQVVVRLVERLEGARRSVATDEERAQAEFGRIAADFVEAAVGEYGEVALEEPQHHAAFLRTEVMETFLPRYRRLALKMTEREEQGYGLGRLAEPLGRLLLGGAALVALYLEMRFLVASRLAWPLIPVILAVPFAPDMLRVASRNQYRNELQALVDDMEKIQKQAEAYTRPERLRSEPLQSAAPRVPPAERERSGS